jgi:group II intron reverse transcriptase/maturase
MRKAETVLGIIHERGKQGKPLEDTYRQLYNPELYLRAYARLYPNKGALTPGITPETVDGMSLAKIEGLIDEVRYERHRWTPVRRVNIPKKNGKTRPLGVPIWSDKLLQEVMRQILEAYYEPQFSDLSHGFRPGRGCHTALSRVVNTWTGINWFIEGDISQCFDKLDHEVLMQILGEKLHDNRFLGLIRNMLKAGYLANWKWNATLSGTPQGGIASPILANIYLHKLDEFVEKVLLPKYNRGETRKINPAYASMTGKLRRAQKQGRTAIAKELRKQRRALPSVAPVDLDYRRLRYIRYADDFLLGFFGPKAEAEEIKRDIRQFLRETLKLELSESKTLITHARTEAARFLNYAIRVQHADDRLDYRGRRSVNGVAALLVPEDVIVKKCSQYMQYSKPAQRPVLLHDSDYTIISQYQAEYRGFVQYYAMAQNVSRLYRLHWVMQVSLLKTLANKHQTTVNAMVRKYQALADTPYGKRKCLRAVVQRGEGQKPLVAQFGGIPLRRQKGAILEDQGPYHFLSDRRSELLQRLLADECELCGSTGQNEVHHIRRLADLKRKGRKEKPVWMQTMIARRRKTLIVCQSCHDAIHAGTMSQQLRRK